MRYRTHALGICMFLTVLFVPFLSHANPPKTISSGVSMLDKALMLTHRTRADIRLTRAITHPFFALARNSVVNDVLENPFLLPPFIQVYGAKLNGHRNPVTPSALFLTALEMVGGDFKRFRNPEKVQNSLVETLNIMNTECNRGLLSSATREFLENQIRSFPPGLEEPLSVLCEALTEAAMARKEAVAQLSEKELAFITEHPSDFFPVRNNPDEIRFHQNTGKELKYLEIIRKIDLSRLLFGMKILSEAVEITRPKLQYVHQQKQEGCCNKILFTYNSPLGPIVVGGRGINRYEKDIALLVDIDGADVYHNNAGGTRGVFGGVACLIDMGGNDTYYSLSPGVQGSGLAGIGMLIDYRGKDSYFGEDCCQAAALAGVGLLYDEKGDDTFHGTQFTQGAAGFGIGVLADINGNDFLTCDSLGQGFGTTLGIGVCTNIYGNDSYCAGIESSSESLADSGFAQGCGVGFQSADNRKFPDLWGGIGFLIDRHGNDTYEGNVFCQGAAYFLSIGALLDNEGNDVYMSSVLSQGAGRLLSGGILVDQKGNDNYCGGRFVQGVGDDHATGMLLDYSGDDVYRDHGEKTLGFGQPPRGFGLHIDYRGNDLYDARNNALGKIPWNVDISTRPIGVFINHRGVDTYLIDGELNPDIRDNSTWYHESGAVGIDTKLKPVMYFANQKTSSKIQHYRMTPIIGLENGDENGRSRLGSSDVFTRFHAPALLIPQGLSVLERIVKAVDMGHAEFRRTLDEAIISLMFKSKNTDEKVVKLMRPLVDSIDPETRRLTVALLGRFASPTALEMIRTRLNDEAYDVRFTAAVELRNAEDRKAVPALTQMASHDPEADCRLIAIDSLYHIAGKKSAAVFREALQDTDRTIKIKAARILAEIKDKKSAGMLQLLAASNDPDLRRVTAESLIRIGDPTGFPILIDLLNYTDTDSMEAAQRELIPVFLAHFAGVDLGADQVKWRKWWLRNGTTLNLEKNIRAEKEYRRFFSSLTGKSIKSIYRTLRNLRRRYPAYHGYDIVLARDIFRRLNKMIHQKHLERYTLKLAKAALQLDPSVPRYYGIAVDLYALDGKFTSARKQLTAALKKFPENEFLTRKSIQLSVMENKMNKKTVVTSTTD